MVVVPGQVFSGSGHAVGIVFEDEVARAEDIVLEVLVPVDGAHVELEDAPVAHAQLIEQQVSVARHELPLARREKVQRRNGLVGLVVQSNLRAKTASPISGCSTTRSLATRKQ